MRLAREGTDLALLCFRFSTVSELEMEGEEVDERVLRAGAYEIEDWDIRRQIFDPADWV